MGHRPNWTKLLGEEDLAQGHTTFPCHFQVAPRGLGERAAGQSPPRRQGKFPGYQVTEPGLWGMAQECCCWDARCLLLPGLPPPPGKPVPPQPGPHPTAPGSLPWPAPPSLQHPLSRVPSALSSRGFPIFLCSCLCAALQMFS